jgi:DNA-binding NarL/FixJ family response regulator
MLGAKIRVLIADDDARFLDALAPLVDSQPGLAVVGTAADGAHALELAEELRPDAVVLDVHMPRVDGVEAIATLREAHPHLCLIALTGDARADLHERVRAAGADAVLEKHDFHERLLERLTTVRHRG